MGSTEHSSGREQHVKQMHRNGKSLIMFQETVPGNMFQVSKFHWQCWLWSPTDQSLNCPSAFYQEIYHSLTQFLFCRVGIRIFIVWWQRWNKWIWSSFFFFCSLLIFCFFPFIFTSWRLITLQYCSGFCHTLTWISHGFTCVPHPDLPSRLPPHPIPLGLPSAPALSTCLMHPTWAGDLFHPW